MYILYIVIKDHYIPNASVSGEDSQVRNIQSENLTPNCGLRCSKESKNVQNISVTQFEESICYYTAIQNIEYAVCMYAHLHI